MRVPFLDLDAMHDEIRSELDAAWQAVSTTNAFIGGDHLDRFEARFAEYCGQAHAVGVGNGTDALELILAALGIGSGDDVIIPANTFLATAEAVVNVGAQPVFVDVAPTTLLVDPSAVEAAVTDRTAAVIAVHLYGQPVDLPAIEAVCDRHGLALIEDAAQAHGASWDGAPAGSVGVATGFSFYPGKNLGAFGDGGAVVTGDASLAERIRSLSNHGRSGSDRDRHPHRGRNSRLDGLQAAVLDLKLDHLDRWNECRRRAAGWYAELLPSTARAVETAPLARAVHHLMVVEVDDRSGVRAELDQAGVGTGIHYQTPCHRQEAFAEFATGPMPVTEAAASRIVSLPMFPHLTRDQVEAVCQALTDATQ